MNRFPTAEQFYANPPKCTVCGKTTNAMYRSEKGQPWYCYAHRELAEQATAKPSAEAGKKAT